MNQLEFQILDLLTEEFTTVWEILSLAEKLNPAISKTDVKELVCDALGNLLTKGYILLYVGTDFMNEEKEVPNFNITKEFIDKHEFDWKTKQFRERDYRFGITEQGMKAYNLK